MYKIIFFVSLFCFIYVCATPTNIGLLLDDDSANRSESFNYKATMEYLTPIRERLPLDDPLEAQLATCSLLERGVAAIFAPLSAENALVVQSICDAKEIPLIETRWDDNLQRGATVINVHPYPGSLGKAYADIVRGWNWEKFAIFYEDNEGLIRISELLKMEENQGRSITVWQLDKNQTRNYRPILKEAWRADQRNFVLDCNIEHLADILLQAQQIGLMTHLHSYIITNLDMHTIDLDPYMYSETNITGIRIVNPNSRAVKDFATVMKCVDCEEEGPMNLMLQTALMFDAVSLLSSAMVELEGAEEFIIKPLFCNNVDSWKEGYSLVNFMKTKTIEGLTGQVKFDNESFRSEFAVDVLNLREDGLNKVATWDITEGLKKTIEGLTGQVKFDHEGFRSDFALDVLELGEDGLNKVATWNITEGLKVSRTYPSATKVDEFSLRNRTFVVITALTDPYGMLKESPTSLRGNDMFEGFGIDLIHELSLMEGFNYTFIIREDKANGVKDPVTGKWSGMIGDLMDGTADLAITDLTITSEREEAVDFTSPFMNLGISILYKKPSKAPPNFFSFAEPFAFEIWAWLAIAYFVVSFSLFIMGRLCPSEWTNPYPCIDEPEFLINQFSLRNSFWFTIGSLMQQGTELAPIAYATRMTAGIWWFFTLIMVSSYTANLAAFLATENPDSPFNDIFELAGKAEKYGIKYGAKKGGATASFFKDSNITEYKKIYETMMLNKDAMVKENKDGVEKAEKESYAFFMESTSIEYEIQRHCNLTQIGGMLDEKGYGIAMRKESSYRHVLGTAVLKLQESGKIAALKRKWWEERRGGGQCSQDAESQEAKALNLKNVGGVFWVTVGGVALALVLVLVEMMLHTLKIAVQRKASFSEELKEELKFFINFKGLVKPVRIRKGESKSPDDSEKSIRNTPVSYGGLPDITKERHS